MSNEASSCPGRVRSMRMRFIPRSCSGAGPRYILKCSWTIPRSFVPSWPLTSLRFFWYPFEPTTWGCQPRGWQLGMTTREGRSRLEKEFSQRPALYEGPRYDLATPRHIPRFCPIVEPRYNKPYSHGSESGIFSENFNSLPPVLWTLVVRTGFCTCILAPVFGAGLSQITWFWTYRISAAIPGFQGRVNDYEN